MLADERLLLLRERAGLPQDVVGDGELPDVVQLRGPLQLLELVTLKAQPTDRDREGDDRLRMLGEGRLAP